MPGETWVTVKPGPDREIVAIQYGPVRARPIPPEHGRVTTVVPDNWMDGRLFAENRAYLLVGSGNKPSIKKGAFRIERTGT